MSTFLSSIPKNRVNLIKAFNWLAAYPQTVFTCLLKFNLTSITIPKSLTAERDSIFSFLMFIVSLTLKFGRIKHYLIISKPSQSYLTLVF